MKTYGYDIFFVVCRYNLCTLDEDYLPDDTNGHCYYRMPSLTFSDAVSLCRTRKSDLAAVTSKQIRADLEFLMDSA